MGPHPSPWDPTCAKTPNRMRSTVLAVVRARSSDAADDTPLAALVKQQPAPTWEPVGGAGPAARECAGACAGEDFVVLAGRGGAVCGGARPAGGAAAAAARQDPGEG